MAAEFPCGEARANDHAIRSAVVLRAFEELDVAASVVRLERKPVWHGIQSSTYEIIDFERSHGRELERERYNTDQLERLRASRRSEIGEHAGLSDLWVPLVSRGQAMGAIVCGPFFTREPTLEGLSDQWRGFSRKKPTATEAGFFRYVSIAVNVPVFRDRELQTFVELVECLAALFMGLDDAAATASRAEHCLYQCLRVTQKQRMSRVVSSMVYEHSSPMWLGPLRSSELRNLGLPAPPTDVGVVLAYGDRGRRRTPIEHWFERASWQSACAEMAAAAGDTLVGPLGQTGVLFLARAAPNLAQRRQKVLALCQKARDLAGGFGMQACAAVGPFGSYQTLPRRVVACRTAAEQALLTNTPILDAKEGGSLLRAQSELGELARAIVDAIERHPERVELIVDRYLEVVALRSAFRPEVAFAYVDCLINDLLRVVTRAVGATRRALESALRELQRQDAATLSDVLARAREALLDLAAAVRQPLQADRELRLRRAEDYVLSRFTEHVTMPAAARAAGYAPAYFSRLFKQQYGTTFERYLLDLRLDRARELLRNTDVSIERVAQSSGFRSLDYFFHVFRARTGMAPGAYRRSSTANGSPQID